MGRKKAKVEKEAVVQEPPLFEDQLQNVKLSLQHMAELKADYEKTLQRAQSACEAATRYDFAPLQDLPALPPPAPLDLEKLPAAVRDSPDLAEHIATINKARALHQRLAAARQDAPENSLLNTKRAGIENCIGAVIAWSEQHLRSWLPAKPKA